MKTLIILAALCCPLALQARGIDEFPARSGHTFELFDIQRGGAGDFGDADGRSGHELGDISAGGSIGLAFDEIGFLATGEADFWFARFFSVGPQVQFNAGRDFFLLVGGGPKVTFDFGDNDFSNLVKPYISLGPALVLGVGEHEHIHHHRHHDHDTEVGFAITLSTGVDFYVTNYLSLGTGFVWNWMVTSPLDDRFFFGWKMIQATYHF